MALEIFKLVGSIFIDNEKANDSLQKTDKKATSVAEGLGKAGKVAAGAAAAIGTAIIGTGTALVGMANDASKTADDIDKMSQKIGMSAEGYQEWSYIMEQNGMDVDKLQTGMKTLVNQMDKVKSGNEDAIATFQQLGVEVLNADGSMRSQEEVMNDTIRALAGMENSAERAKLATELFGKAGTEMAPMLNQGAGAIDDLKQRAHDLGLVMSDEAVKAGVEYGDLSNDLQKAFSMLKTNLGTALLPVLISVIKKLIEFVPTLQKLGEKLGPIASSFIEQLIPPLADLAASLLPQMLGLVETLIPFLGDITGEIVPILVSTLQELLPPLMDIISTILPPLMDIIKLLAPIISTILKTLTPLVVLILQLLEPLMQLVTAILTPILTLLNAILEPLLNIFVEIMSPYTELLGVLIELLAGLLSAILQPLCVILEAIITPMLTIINKCIQPMFDLLKKFTAWLEPTVSKMSEFLGGFFSFLIQEIGTNVKNKVDEFWTMIKRVGEFFTGTFVPKMTGAFNSVKDTFSRIWDGLKQMFRDGVNSWIDVINTFIRGLNMIQPPQWLADKVGISGISMGEIPRLATGGEVQKQGRVMVGEDGPEYLDLPVGAKVTPLNKSEIDYDKLASAVVRALKASGFGTITVPVIVDGMVSEERIVNAFDAYNYRSGGR